MGVARSSSELEELLRLPSGGAFVITDELGNELFRVTADGDVVRVAGKTITAAALPVLTSLVTLVATAAELNKLAGASTPLFSARRSFFQTAGNGTYTASITVPAGALICDIKVWSTALWNAGTSAAMDVGDADDPDGWFKGIDLKATDLLVGEEINFTTTGGKEGAYLVPADGVRSAAHSTLERVISGVVTQVGNGSAGITYLEVIWALPVTADTGQAEKA